MLFHGSDHTVERPQYGFGKTDNDYGSGFYTTEVYERAAEWAMLFGNKMAVVNRYYLDTNGLEIFNLDELGPLAWIAEVVSHRGVSSATARAFVDEFVQKYKQDTSSADIIIGYRADDSYGDVIESFLLGELSVDEVRKLFWKGELGQQVFIKSCLAFEKLQFVESENLHVQNTAGTAISQARLEVMRFIQNRRIQIAKRCTVPEISIADALAYHYIYHADGGYYERR